MTLATIMDLLDLFLYFICIAGGLATGGATAWMIATRREQRRISRKLIGVIGEQELILGRAGKGGVERGENLYWDPTRVDIDTSEQKWNRGKTGEEISADIAEGRIHIGIDPGFEPKSWPVISKQEYDVHSVEVSIGGHKLTPMEVTGPVEVNGGLGNIRMPFACSCGEKGEFVGVDTQSIKCKCGAKWSMSMGKIRFEAMRIPKTQEMIEVTGSIGTIEHHLDGSRNYKPIPKPPELDPELKKPSIIRGGKK